MNFYIGVTDPDWYGFLYKKNFDKINFWKPGGQETFNVLQPGEPFLFKLRGTPHRIGGLGYFVEFKVLHIKDAWEHYQEKNGAATYDNLLTLISHNKKGNNKNSEIGCVILRDPVFFKSFQRMSVPNDWKVSGPGKGYSTDSTVGREFWEKIKPVL